MSCRRVRLAVAVAAVAATAGCGGSADGPCVGDGRCVDVDQPGAAVDRPPGLVVDATWGAPVPDPTAISSTFGPRWKTSAGRDDFHPGIDFFDAPGTPIYAIGDGVVDGVYPDGSSTYPNGGNVVVIRHDLPTPSMFHDRPVTRFYAVYLHLASIAVIEAATVTRGQDVGTMGMTGDTVFVHLHFEIRVETKCSLPYQLDHPDSGCALGFDPHVHPFLFIGGANSDQVEVSAPPTDAGYLVRYRATRGDLDLDTIETDLGTVGFVERIGIDANSLTTLDDFDYGWLRIEPEPFGSGDNELVYDLHFARPLAYLELRDIHGHGLRFAP